MKTDKKKPIDNMYVSVAAIMIILYFALSAYLQAAENNEIGFEFVAPTMTSEHKDQCKPWCANQKNGGKGFILHYRRLDKGSVDLAIGRIEFTNSYGDPGKVEFVQLLALKHKYKFLTFEADVWKMRIHGYKKEVKTGEYYIGDDGEVHERKEYKDIIVDTPPWPIYKLGINPLYAWTNNFNINYYALFFPVVRINFLTVSYDVRF